MSGDIGLLDVDARCNTVGNASQTVVRSFVVCHGGHNEAREDSFVEAAELARSRPRGAQLTMIGDMNVDRLRNKDMQWSSFLKHLNGLGLHVVDPTEYDGRDWTKVITRCPKGLSAETQEAS